MVRARGDSGLDGFVNLWKERGPTSQQAVAAARRALGTRRVGHAGTLDPMAEGVLPLAVGRATRLLDRLTEATKEYYAEARLGVRTTSHDAEGEVVEERPVPPLGPGLIDEILREFAGSREQRPPAFSALKVGGRRAYALARAGSDVVLQPRRVTIYAIERRLLAPPTLGFAVTCSKGTYVRALARDLGDRLGTGASLSRLVRTRVGPFCLGTAVSVAELAERPDECLLPPDEVLLDEPALVLNDAQREHVRHGRSWSAPAQPRPARGYTRAGQLACILTASADRWQPRLPLVD